MYSNYLASAEDADSEATVLFLHYWFTSNLRSFLAFEISSLTCNTQGTASTGQFWTSDLLESAQKYKSKMGKTQTSLSAVGASLDFDLI